MAAGEPLVGITNVIRPKKISFEQVAREVVTWQGETKTVVFDPKETYLGPPLSINSLVTA
ncbi:hypothetical protein [Mycobacterium lepromatosis]|uniref:hypothetical protein n=1 Tax=Mycobacterium lepromatosis TaxID=480418 RepID=UPI0006791934|nr:hypothetical protein [Mycobacterium lepromatosis]